MNKAAIMHQIESAYCFPTSKNTLELRIRFAKEDQLDEVKVIYGCKYSFYTEQKEKDMEYYLEDDTYVYYHASLSLDDVRVAYVFKIKENGKTYYFSCDGLTETYNFKTSYYNFFQVAYINDADIMKEVSWAKDAVIYEIFIDRFKRGCQIKDESYINLAWNDIPNPKSFAGGDLEGIIESLDYLLDLGVNTLYLTPVFKSISNHKYDISDYYEISEHFGDKETLKRLIVECHKRGMHVILDAVFNHISSLSNLFSDVIKNGKESPYFDWFIIKGDQVDLEQSNFECFSVCSYMPKFNTSNPEVVDYLIDVGKHYVNEYNIDGWRLDVSDEVSHDFWRQFRREIKKCNKDVLLTGENWQDGNSYLQGDQFDGIMNYSFSRVLNDYLAFDLYGAKDFVYNLNRLLVRYQTAITNMNWSMLDSHDSYRFYTQVKKDKNKALMALALMMMYPGIPCIYYGDELPLEGGYDPDCRRCFDWEMTNDKNKFYQNYKKIIHIREKEEVKYGMIEIASKDELVYLKRTYNEKVVTLVLNHGAKKVKLDTDSIIFSIQEELGYLNDNEFVIYESEV